MKKIWLTIVGSAFIAISAVHAQDRSSDTTQTSTEQSTNYRKSDTRQQKSDQQSSSQYGSQWSDQERQSVSKEDLPEDLVETLKSDKYQGWENATIYRNKTTDEYMLVMQENGTVRTLYFDQEGNEKSIGAGAQGSSNYGTEPSSSGSSYGTSTDTTSTGSSTQYDTSGSTGTSGSQYGTQSPSGSRAGSDSDTMSQSRTSSDTPPESYGTGTTGTSGSTGTSGTTGSTSDMSKSSGNESWQSTSKQGQSSWRAEDRVIVTTDDLPSSLRITLDDDKYKGWENSTLYRNRSTNEYMVEIRDGSSSKIYYFDKDGKPLDSSSTNK